MFFHFLKIVDITLVYLFVRFTARTVECQAPCNNGSCKNATEQTNLCQYVDPLAGDFPILPHLSRGDRIYISAAPLAGTRERLNTDAACAHN